jgi:WD40 repeat protein
MQQFRKSIAVVIGINNYDNGISCLKNAVSDAEKIGEMLEREHDYELRLLINQEATGDGLRNLLRTELPAQIGAEDRVLFYFAGHGMATDNDDGPAGYLVPQDARPEDGSTFLSMIELHEALSALECRHLLVVLDCCFAGAFRWSSTRFLKPEAKVVYQERFARYIADPAWQVITSAAHDEKAQDKRGEGEHSPFALAFLEALQGAGDIFPPGFAGEPPGDGVITVTELYLFLRNQLGPSAVSGIRQTPSFWPLRKHDKGEYVFLNPIRQLALPTAETLTAANNPYRGLKPFEEQHSNLFFGRESVENDLADKVLANPLTVVVGPSGSGKSSVVKAGLIPRLRQLGNDHWHIPSTLVDNPGAASQSTTTPRALALRPGVSPLQALEEFIHDDSGLSRAYTSVKPDFHNDPQALGSLIKQWSDENPKAKLLFFVDQLEELVTMCPHKKEQLMFLRQLSEALTAHPQRLRIVLTVRSDFESQFLHSALEDRWRKARFIVPPMSQNELRQAIEGPASARVVYFESSSLVDEIINEVVQMPGALPLLSFTLSEMYIKYLQSGRADRVLTEQDYKSLGGVVGSLRRRANEEFAQLKNEPARQETMQRVILRMVAREGNEVARRRVPRSELVFDDAAENQRVADIVDQLTSARLLVEGTNAQNEPYVEPAHDALVRGWDLLWTWLLQEQEHQDTLLLLRRLTQAATDWEDAGRKPGSLWDDDPRSPLVEALQDRRKFWTNRLESEFVLRSASLRKSKRRKRNSWVTAAAVVLAASTVFAGYQAIQARAQRDFAVASQREADAQRTEADKQRDTAIGVQKVADKEREKAVTARNDANTQRDIATKEKNRAQAAEQQANEDRDRAQAQLAESRYTSAQAEVDNHNDLGKALLLVSKSLEAAPAKDPRREVFAQKAIYLSSRLPRRVTQLPAPISYAKFSPNRERVLTHSFDYRLRLWNVKTGQEYPIPQLPFAKFFLAEVAFDLSGQKIAILINERISWARMLCAWQTDTVAPLFASACIPVVKGTESDLAFSPDGNYIMIGRNEPLIGREITTWSLKAPSSDPTKLIINPSYRIADWSSSSSPLDVLIQPTKDYFVLSPNPSHNWMITLKTNQTGASAQIVDIDTQAPLAGSAPITTGYLQSIRFSPDVRRVITISGAPFSRVYEMQLWDAATGAPVPTTQKMRDEYQFELLDISPSGRKIVTTGSRERSVLPYTGERVRVWDTSNGSSRYISIDKAEREYGIVFSEDENSLVAVSKDHTLRSIDISSGELAAEPFHFPVPANDLFFVQADFLLSPGASSLTSLTTDGSLSLWDTKVASSPAKVTPLPHEPTKNEQWAFTAAHFTPDRRAVLTQSMINNVIQLQLWSVDTGKPLWSQPIALASSGIHLSMSLDGRRLATAEFSDFHMKAFINVFDMADATLLNYEPMAIDDVFTLSDIALNKTGDRVAVAWTVNQGGDYVSQAQQWEVKFQSPLGSPAKHEMGRVTFLQDGVHYLVGSRTDLTIHNIEEPAEISPQFHFENNSGLQARLAERLILQAVDVRLLGRTGVQIFYPFGSLLINTSPFGSTITNLKTNSLLTTPSAKNPRESNFEATFSPDGKWVVTSNSYNERVREHFNRNWNLTISETQTGQPLWDSLWHENQPLAAVFDLPQNRFISITADGNLRIWNLTSNLKGQPGDWSEQMGTAITGARLSSERTVQRIPQLTYSPLRERFFERLKREARTSIDACLILNQFEDYQCTGR